jgi:hypothetical protein
MALGSRQAKAWPLLALAAIVIASAAQAVWWVFLVPIYQSPDEPAHLDYALAIHAHGGLIFAQNATFKSLPADAHTYTGYLRARSNLQHVAFNPGAKMPPEYGTPEFFEALDREAPSPAALQTDQPCQLASLYPFGYYAVLAVWIQCVGYFKNGIVAMFYGARLFSVVLLIVSLVLSYATVRLLNFKPAFALLATACIGAFPLTSFVASYVQPDNLSFTLVSLSFYLSLRAKVKGLTVGGLLMLGTALGALLVTKVHFWLCVTPAVLAMLAAEMAVRPAGRRQWLRAGAALAVPSLILGSVWLWTVWGTENYFAPRERHADRLTHVVRLTRQALNDFFCGTTHVSFWGTFGWLDTPLHFRNPRMTDTMWFLIQAATYGMLGLTLLRLEQVASRLFRVARAGRAKTAARIALSNPALNSYFLFSVFMLFLYVWTSNRFGAQGRNWFPFMLPIVLTGLWYAPKALTLPTSRRALAGLAAAGLLFHGLVGNHYARASIRDRFYFEHSDRPMTTIDYSADPTDLNDMTWDARGGDSTGCDPYAIFALERPVFVYGMKLRFTVTNPANRPAKFQLFWKNSGQNFVEHERWARYDIEPGREKTLIVWMNCEMSHFRIDPDSGPGRIELHAVTLMQKQEGEDSRRERRRRP